MQQTALTIATRNRMAMSMNDIIQVLDAAPNESLYGSDAMKYSVRLDTDGNPVQYRGSLQPEVRNPNLPEMGGNVLTSSPYMIKLQWDAVIPTTSRLQVNGGGLYQVQRTNADKSDRYTLDVFCYQVK